jgi:hypothetical protein
MQRFLALSPPRTAAQRSEQAYYEFLMEGLSAAPDRSRALARLNEAYSLDQEQLLHRIKGALVTGEGIRHLLDRLGIRESADGRSFIAAGPN